MVQSHPIQGLVLTVLALQEPPRLAQAIIRWRLRQALILALLLCPGPVALPVRAQQRPLSTNQDVFRFIPPLLPLRIPATLKTAMLMTLDVMSSLRQT